MLTVCVITLNEEKHLQNCLESVKESADEIIVVDSGSTDRTLEIAKSAGAKIYHREFDNYANQKNYAVGKASGDWVLSMDGDEEIEKELSIEINEAIKTGNYVAYTMPRKNIIFGKFIRYTRWQPELDRHIWLFRKEKSKWAGDVHEEVEVKGEVGHLTYAKVHYQYETIAEFIEMTNRYSNLEAREKHKSGYRFSLLSLILVPIYNFLVRYMYRLGFLDGAHGFILSFLMAVYHFQVIEKVWELERSK